jgi:methionine synthase I (cobalamin-dependent)
MPVSSKVGCDVIETDSFGSTSIVLAEYNIAEQAYDLNFKAAELAKESRARLQHFRQTALGRGLNGDPPQNYLRWVTSLSST